MNNISRALDIKDSALKGSQKTDTVQQCLTAECKDCTGSYINRAFEHRLICLCKCHKVDIEKRCSVVKTDLNQYLFTCDGT